MTWIEKHEISVYDSDIKGQKVLHSPLARKAAVVSAKRFDGLKDLSEVPQEFSFLTDYVPYSKQPSVKSPEDYTLLTVLPNNRCNFACTYCYSAKSRDDHNLGYADLRECLNYFITTKENKPSRKKLTVSFMGGGEPMLSWDLIRRGVEYAESMAALHNVVIHFRIITNGSLIDEDQLKFIADHNIGVSVSFEVLKEIQNLQRRHYEIVDKNLRILLDAGVDTQLNITVTPACVNRMLEIYTVMREMYPAIRNAMFEPVTSEKMFATPEDMRDFYNTYTQGFIDIYCRGLSEGVSITSFQYLRSVYPIRRACPGEFCLTADGKITGCYCVSTPAHPLFSQACYGGITKGKFQFDQDRYQSLMAHNVDTDPKCKECSARWNCGGGCWYQFKSYSAPYQSVVCEFTRDFIRRIVLTQLTQKL